MNVPRSHLKTALFLVSSYGIPFLLVISSPTSLLHLNPTQETSLLLLVLHMRWRLAHYSENDSC